ncbi:MAG: UDP-N-acetylmuramate:L-alanyl-gamma-D-glutamyl-meso-diaminopimelate ligase [Granulosicoccaceae bacterium]
MHIHIMGVCGTFMGGVARLARELGHSVSGSDRAFYPPMSDQLDQLGIELRHGYSADNLKPAPDLVIVGNALTRGNPEVEALLDSRIPYTSGAQWLGDVVLRERWVLAVAGTHGKTTTSSMLAWLLEHAGLKPGFLIGGVPGNFDVSARLGESPFFVVEADEYDTAFFDKRSKFVHYRPNTLILNNLEFDHADIFDDLEAIKRQFHHLIRCVPSKGRVVVNADAGALQDVLARGCWSETESFSEHAQAPWQLCEEQPNDAIEFEFSGKRHRVRPWQMAGRHNALNAVAAIMAARHAGVTVEHSCEAMRQFVGVRRRLDFLGERRGAVLYDDFAHHPTAIGATLAGLAERHPDKRLLAVVELRSNSMRAGAHTAALPTALERAEQILVFALDPESPAARELRDGLGEKLLFCQDKPQALAALQQCVQSTDCVVFMSNGDMQGLQTEALQVL